MKARNSPAGNGDKQAGQEVHAVHLEPGKRGNFNRRGRENHPDKGGQHHGNQQEGIEVIPGLPQGPHGNHRGDEYVGEHQVEPHGLGEVQGKEDAQGDTEDEEVHRHDPAGQIRRLPLADKEAESNGRRHEETRS